MLAALSASRRPDQTLIGFAAEHGEGAVDRGRGKLERKGLDAVVVNDISRADIGFDTARQRGHDRHRRRRAAGRPIESKAAVAAAVLDAVESLRKSAGDGEYR